MSQARVLTAAFLLFAVVASGASDAASPEAIPFRQAVEMALQHSGIMAIANINQWRARAVYHELRNNYFPQLTVGSGLGYSYGFPLTLEGSAPSVVNFTSINSLFNLSLRQFMKAAKIDWQANAFEIQDKRNAVILDTALSYAQLQQVTGKIKALTEAQAAADKAEFVSQERLQQGVDSQLELTRSKLLAARVRLRLADAQAQADVLREHLSKLMGVPAESVAVAEATMPALPLISQDTDVPAQALQNSPVVRVAEQKLAAAQAKAKGEHRTMMPTIDLATQYAYLARFNNYDLYYTRYLANNFSGGLNIRFPFFNPVAKARAEQADLDALQAREQLQLTKNQTAENALKLQRSLRQLEAARDVAKLEWQVSQGEMEAVDARASTGGANLRDQQNARLGVQDKYASYLDAEFELSRAELQLMRVTGELENWALPPH